MGLQVGHLFVCGSFKHWSMESRTQVIHILAVCPTQKTKDHKGANMSNFNKPRPTSEDEAFNDIERMSKVKQELVKTQMKAKTEQEFYDELRNSVLEETAEAIEKMRGFGGDTINSFAVFIRGMKR
jgi:hypothetical protein